MLEARLSTPPLMVSLSNHVLRPNQIPA